MRYGLIEITDWGFYLSDETKKKLVQKKKKMDEKTAITFSESARFLPVGRLRSNKHFLFLAQTANQY